MDVVALVVVLVLAVAVIGWRAWRLVQGGRQAIGTMRELKEEFERQRQLHDAGHGPDGPPGARGSGVNPRTDDDRSKQ